MSFSYKSETLRSGNTYDSRALIEMSAHEEDVTEGTELNTNDENEENSVRFSPEMVDERIKENLETLHAQVFALTEMIDRLIQGDSVKEFITASTRELRNQPELPLAGTPGTFRFPTMAPLFTA